MTPLIALPAGLSAAADTPADIAAAGAALPSLPVLSAMLREARRLPGAATWRHAVLCALHGADLPDIPVASIAASALPVQAPGSGVCMVTPVHAVAGMSRVYLSAGENAALSPPERESLRQSFNTEFGASDMQLHAAGSGWLLVAPCAAATDDPDPDLLRGMPLARQPALSAAGRAMRRLGAEVEMWLSTLPANREREARGMAPVNSFWFWGGGVSKTIAPPDARPAAIFSNVAPDAWLQGLARHCNVAPPAAVDGWRALPSVEPPLVVLQPPPGGHALEFLPIWEERWLEPAWREHRAGRRGALHLQLGQSTWELPGPRVLRWFRRAQPWWQAVQP